MNKIYSLKYSSVTGGLVAVSELTKKVTTASRKKLRLSSVVLLPAGVLFATGAMASHMWIDNFYVRDYLDFAQNKGVFTAGNENISIIKKMVLFINYLMYHFLTFLLLPIKEQRHQLAGLIV